MDAADSRYTGRFGAPSLLPSTFAGATLDVALAPPMLFPFVVAGAIKEVRVLFVLLVRFFLVHSSVYRGII